MVDAYGSQNLTAAFIERLESAGIEFRWFGRLYSRGRFHLGRRLHRKVIVIDASVSVVGGINIADHYNDMHGQKAWLDFAVIITGEASRRLWLICRQRWFSIRFRRFSVRLRRKHFQISGQHTTHTPVKISQNDFVRNKHDIAITYRQSIRQAQKSIMIVGGYFLPGGTMRRLFRHAVERGVEITVIFAEKSDVGVLVEARRYLYNWLLTNGIRLFEYKPSNVHGKVLIRDDVFTTLGSYDLNNLSTYSNIELNADIDDADFSQSLKSHLKKIMKTDCREITRENFYRKNSVWGKIKMWSAYRFVKTLFVLSVLLAGKRKQEF
jgi:cardiolipin synthase